MGRAMSALEYLTPASNPNLIGHEKAERTFLQACKGQRLHHAWLISGSRGIGKATLAYRFARYVFFNFKSDANLFGNSFDADKNYDSLNIPQDHPIFQRVAARGHADLLVIERSQNKQGNLSSAIIAEDVRNARNFLHMTAGEGGWRIVIIDSADDMNDHAANALLKILEEPPPRTLLMLISHNPGRLLPTIQSRCQRIRLKPLRKSDLVSWLSAGDLAASIADPEVISILAEGSIGRAIELIELDGVNIYTDILTLFEGLPIIEARHLHAFASKISSKKSNYTFNLTSELIRWLLARVIKYAARGFEEEMTLKEQALFEKIIATNSLDRWLKVWDKVEDLFASADRASLDRKQVILTTFSFISQASDAQ